MNAHTCKSCYGGGIRKEDDEIQAQRVQHIALVIGYNELAKQGQTLGEKLYYRLFRDHSEEAFIKMGGHKILTRDDGICEIDVPGHTPHIVFTASDIELMRAAVAEHDAKKAAKALKSCGKEWDLPDADGDTHRNPHEHRHCGDLKCLACNEQAEHDERVAAKAAEPLPEHYGRCEYCGDIITLKTHPQAQWADPHTDEHCFESLKAAIESGELHRGGPR